MKIRVLVLAVSLAIGSSAALAGTVSFGAVGYGQYDEASAYSLPIANYQFGYDMGDGPFVPAVSPMKENLLSAALGASVDKSGESLGFSNSLDKLYPALPGNASSKSPQNNTASQVAGDKQPPASPLITKGNGLLPPGPLASSKNAAPASALGSEYPTATPSLSAWSKEWVTDTSDVIEEDFQPPKLAFVSTSLGGAKNAEDGALVNFNGGTPAPVAGSGTSNLASGAGSIISSAYGSSGGSSGSRGGSSGSGGGSSGSGGGSSGSGGGTGGDGSGGTPPSGNTDPENQPQQPTQGEDPDKCIDPATGDKVPECVTTYIDPPKDPVPEDETQPLPPPGPTDQSGGTPSQPGDPLGPLVPTPTGAGDPATNQTPEPATLMLLGGALLGLSVLRRRVKA